MTRRRWRRMELARPARDAVVVRESTVVVRFPFSRARSRVGRPARHLFALVTACGAGAARIRSWRRERSFGSLDRGPSLRIDNKNPEAEQAFCQTVRVSAASGQRVSPRSKRQAVGTRGTARGASGREARSQDCSRGRAGTRPRLSFARLGEQHDERRGFQPLNRSLGEQCWAESAADGDQPFQRTFRNGP
jgi:hypothetical protein